MNDAKPIVIVGIGGVFPGADNMQQYWDTIIDGKTHAQPMPAHRSHVDIHKVHSPNRIEADAVSSVHGCYVDHNQLQLDEHLLDIDKTFVDSLDPMFKVGLYAAQEAWRDAKTQQHQHAN